MSKSAFTDLRPIILTIARSRIDGIARIELIKLCQMQSTYSYEEIQRTVHRLRRKGLLITLSRVERESVVLGIKR